jgi:hypothetical protein
MSRGLGGPHSHEDPDTSRGYTCLGHPASLEEGQKYITSSSLGALLCYSSYDPMSSCHMLM